MKGQNLQEIPKFSREHTTDCRLPWNKFRGHRKGHCSKLSQRLHGLFSRRSEISENRGVPQDGTKSEECSDNDTPSLYGPADAAADTKDRHVPDSSHVSCCSTQDTQTYEKQQPFVVGLSAGEDETLAESNPTVRAVRDSTEFDQALLMPVASMTGSGTQFASESLHDQGIVQAGLSSKHKNHSVPNGNRKPPPKLFKFKGEVESKNWELLPKRNPSLESMVCQKAAQEEKANNIF